MENLTISTILNRFKKNSGNFQEAFGVKPEINLFLQKGYKLTMLKCFDDILNDVEIIQSAQVLSESLEIAFAGERHSTEEMFYIGNFFNEILNKINKNVDIFLVIKNKWSKTIDSEDKMADISFIMSCINLLECCNKSEINYSDLSDEYLENDKYYHFSTFLLNKVSIALSNIDILTENLKLEKS